MTTDGIATGTFTAPLAGITCELNGTITPRSEGAVYAVTVNAGPPFGSCGLSGDYRGVMTLDTSGLARFSLRDLSIPTYDVGVALKGSRV